MGQSSRPGCGAAADSEYALLTKTVAQELPEDQQVDVTWDHFETSNTGVFATGIGGGVIRNQAGDFILYVQQPGQVVLYTNSQWSDGPTPKYAILSESYPSVSNMRSDLLFQTILAIPFQTSDMTIAQASGASPSSPEGYWVAALVFTGAGMPGDPSGIFLLGDPNGRSILRALWTPLTSPLTNPGGY